MAQTLSSLFAVQSHHGARMLAHVHKSAAKSNLGFVPLEFGQVRLQLKRLSYPCPAHPEQQSVIRGEQWRRFDRWRS